MQVVYYPKEVRLAHPESVSENALHRRLSPTGTASTFVKKKLHHYKFTMNHSDSQFSILAENENGYIGVCLCCHEFNFAYKNILLTFQEEEMFRFFDWVIENRSAPQHYMPLQHNRCRVFTSPHSNLFLVFSDLELDEIAVMYHETRLILSAQKVLHANRMN